jgi:hypothetical protein
MQRQEQGVCTLASSLLSSRSPCARRQVPTVSAFLARQQVSVEDRPQSRLRSARQQLSLCIVGQAMTEDHSAEGDKLRASRAQQSQAEQAKRDREGGSAADVSDGAKTDAAAQGKSAGQLEKEEMMKKARANHQPNAKDFEAQGEREVFDPVTHKMVVIRDAKLEGAFRRCPLRARRRRRRRPSQRSLTLSGRRLPEPEAL